MEQDDDNHLCLRCGQTIVGLDNYVSHRQQGCFKTNQPVSSPFLSSGSDMLTSAHPSDKDLQDPPFTPSDIYKLSAEDFFQSLNLQSIAHSGSGSQRALNNANDNFCSTLENDLDSEFSYEKEILPETIIADTSCINIDRILLPTDKLIPVFRSTDNNFPNEDNEMCPNIFSSKETIISQSTTLVSLKNTHSILEAKEQHEIAQINDHRVSQRNANSIINSTECCSNKKKQFICPLCNFKCVFVSTFLNHLLSCDSRYSNEEDWIREIFSNEFNFIKNSLFICSICSFYSNDKITFINHLKSQRHCQKIAKLKNPLICLPCIDEFSSSDAMIKHFLKNHNLQVTVLHPILITEKKRTSHCCYCLALVKGCISLVSDYNDSFHDIDVSLMSTRMSVVLECAYGIEKNLMGSYFKFCKVLFNGQKKISKKSNALFIDYSDKNVENQDHVPLKAVKKSFVKKLKYFNFRNKYKKVKHTSKQYFCSKCETGFETKLLLKNHLKFSCKEKTVVVKKAYLCDVCGFVCKNFHGMTKHKRYHTGEKPFKCTDCELSFAVSSSLIRHKRTHSGLKPYNCPYCAYVSNTQENLRKHILKTKKHVGKKMYPCKKCDFGCNEFSDYQSHMLNEHSETCSDFQNAHSADFPNVDS